MESTYHTVASPVPTPTGGEPPACRPGVEAESVREMMQSEVDKVQETVDDTADGTEPITLGLAIRRTRLMAFAVAMMASIIGLTVWFHHGMELSHFESRDKTTKEQAKLLDDYNSYSGNVASIFAKPIELFVTVAVQVIVLRFMADTFTRPEMSWKISAVTLLLGAGIGYMISNGFNALNVQLRPQAVVPVIISTDLRHDLGFDDTDFAARSSNLNVTFPETNAKNPVTNTLLRTIVVPKTLHGSKNCQWIEGEYSSDINKFKGVIDEVHESVLDVGFPEHDWQSRILQEALPSKTLRVVVNPTTKNSSATISTLPMNTVLAADLFYYAMMLGPSYFPWGSRHAFANRTEIAQRYSAAPSNRSKPQVSQDDTATFYGLLPSDASLNETAKKAWFLRESMAAASRQFAFSQRTQRSDIGMEFSHTQISPSIAFDAVTFEVELDPMLLATTATADNTTRYTVLDQIYDCPWPEHCLVRKPSYKAVEPAYDSPAQVVAFALCTDANGTESLRTNFTLQNGTVVNDTLLCDGKKHSKNAMLIVSIGKRLVADSLQQNVSVSPTTRRVDANNDTATITNLRKIYSFTVGRLVWELSDLAQQFNAECRVDSGCLGLELPLSHPLGTSSSTPNLSHAHAPQRLVLGGESLPLDLLATPHFLALAKTNLVVLNEPPESTTSSKLYQIMAGDLLLRHNIRNVTWDKQSLHSDCDAQVEDRIVQQLNNHLYMEQSLQTAYTSAVYFLFQNAVVRDVITLSASRQSLAFDENTQQVSVWVSTPAQNMWLTLGGCFVLVAGLLAVLIKTMWSKSKNDDALSRITEPQAIARVMMDERQYPPIFLHRRVVEKNGEENVKRFSIAALSLQQQQQLQQELQEQQNEHRQQRRGNRMKDMSA